MRPVKTEKTNTVFVAPGCGDLPARKFLLANGPKNCIETVWELNEEELRQVRETGRIYLYVVSEYIQPVFILTEAYEGESEGGATEE